MEKYYYRKKFSCKGSISNYHSLLNLQSTKICKGAMLPKYPIEIENELLNLTVMFIYVDLI